MRTPLIRNTLVLALGVSALLIAGARNSLAAPPTTAAPGTDSRLETIVLGMGCFWGAEKFMGQLPGVVDIEVGYANGDEGLPGNYQAVLAHERALRQGKTKARNHAEVAKVTFDPDQVSLEAVLKRFWETHDPTQGDRQGPDVGSNYRSAIYTVNDEQQRVARRSRAVYEQALSAAGLGSITTEIAPLAVYHRAEEYHQDYRKKHPVGECGLRPTGVPYPLVAAPEPRPVQAVPQLEGKALARDRQLVMFEAEGCGSCKQFKAEILDHWQSPVPVARTVATSAPTGWTLEKEVFATPTLVLFENGREVSRYTGYDGDAARFWKWLGFRLLTPEQRRIAFEQGTERAFTGSHLDEKRSGTYVDPITGAPLFRSDTKFDSGTGWPSFFNPVEGAITLHGDDSHGMRRVEVRSASSGIHLGHVFDDGPPPTSKRYCINGKVLKFLPDAEK
jgi:peptide methionine sulfoxide reductase msrA/msrB